MVSSLGQLTIRCTDVARATAFYREVLGIPFLFSAGPALAFFQIGEVRLMLTVPEGEFTGTSTLYWKVADIAAALDGIRTQAELIDEPHMIADMGDHELWMAFFRDSEGNPMAFMEERAKVAPSLEQS
jgi:methylmalonyl-CoA/ethylmalonyl-CoA epimerase